MRHRTTWPRLRKRIRAGRTDYVLDLGCVDTVLPSGERVTRRRCIVRATLAEAQAEVERLRNERARLGDLATRLTPDQIVDASKALSILGGRFSMEYAAQHLLNNAPPTEQVTIRQVYDSLLSDMEARTERGDIRRRHLVSTRSILRSYVEECGGAQVYAVQPADIRDWLQRQRFTSAGTEANVIRHVSLLFSHAVDREWISENPVRKVKSPRVRFQTPKHWTVTQVAEFMALLAEKAQAQIPRAAIGFFAGIRAEELDKLTWEDVKWDAQIIAVSERVAKARRPRAVTISPNLMMWLLPFRGVDGPIGDRQASWMRCRRAICETMGVPWVDNCQRHTFATYHLAYCGDAGKTAKELGHADGVRLLYQRYANAGITKEQAEPYWKIAQNAGGEH